MTTPADVALTQLGVVEETGHNDGVPADRYMRGDKLAWCAGFVMWCYDESDWAPLYRSAKEYYRLRSVQALEDAMKAKGVWYGSRLVGMLRPGDLVFHSTRAGSDAGRGRHVGLAVTGVLWPKEETFLTVDGNYGDKVSQRSVHVDEKSLTGFARPRSA